MDVTIAGVLMCSILWSWEFYLARLPCPAILLALPQVNSVLVSPTALQVPLCISWNSRKSVLEWPLETSSLGVLHIGHIGKSPGELLILSRPGYLTFLSVCSFAMFEFLS